MKKYILPLAAWMLIACNGNESPENTNLTDLIQQRDSLRTVFEDVSVKLKAVEEQLALMDTSAQSAGIPVTTVLLEPEKFQHFVEVHGVVESEKNATINAEANGIIKSINVKKGQTVEKGRVLVVLDNELIQKNIEEVETAYSLAENVFQRQEKLWKQNIGSEMQFLEAKNRKESLEQRLKTLKAQRDLSVVKAPFHGVVDEIFMKEGEMASPMAPLLRLINNDNYYMTADVPENYLSSIKTDTDANVKIPSLNLNFKSKISRIGGYINPNNRTFKIQINLDNKEALLRPNLLTVAELKTFEKDSAAVVPAGAIQQDAKGTEYVFIAERNGKTTIARRVDVKTQLTANNRTLVASGLKGSEEVIVEGARGLKDNDKIEVVK
jgi:membrane fusion protein, multidrug efflux system